MYCAPVFPLRGWGLGNRLFPWARARVFSLVNGVPMLAPVWPRVAIGPLLRGGIDLRNYRSQLLLAGIFRNREGDVSGLRRLAVWCSARQEPEPEAPDFHFTRLANGAGRRVVVFEGLRDFFGRLQPWPELLHRELRAIAHPRYLRLADRLAEVPIAVNVRCGNDFHQPPCGAVRVAPGAKTPIGWFVESLELIREAAGFCTPAYVVSDGTEDQLRELLRMENVTFVRPGCAISDLLILAKGKVLLASGSSSFSAWAAFLGQMPAISVPGQPLSAWRLAGGEGESSEFDPRAPRAKFLEAAARALEARAEVLYLREAAR